MSSDDKPADLMAPEQEAENPQGEAQAAQDAPAPLPGELLSARRQALNLSIDDVSTRVRLAPRQIIALEANDFDALPGMATVRGFIRSYAKLLGMDPAPLVAMLAHDPNPAFDAAAARRPLPASGFRPRRYGPSTQHRRGARRMAGLAAVVLVFVGTLAFIAYRNAWLPAPGAPAEPDAAVTAAPDITVGEAGAKPAQPAAQGPATTSAKPADTGSPAMVPPSSAAPVPASANAAVAAAAPGAAAGALQLSSREDAWVEVIAIRGERKLLSKLMKAGSTELVDVAEPVVLVVGNVAGVNAVLRGQTLNLVASARDNVARLRLE